MGWIKVDRQLQEHWLWEGRFSKGQAWIDLLLLANHDDVKTVYKGEIIVCKRGDVNRSMLYLADRWGWSRKSVKHFLDLLEKDGMVTTKVTTNRTIITLKNWEKYQSKDNEGNNERYSEVHSEGNNEGNNEGNTNKKDKKDKKDKEYICAFDEFWKIYPRKVDKTRAYKQYQARLKDGYTEDQLLTACKNYAAECEKNRTEQRYIKHGATFLSVNEPFLDYLKGEDDGLGERIRADEEQRLAELDEHIRREEAGEFDYEDEELRRIWES